MVKAYQITQWGAPLEEREIPVPEPQGTEILIKVTACGVCHSDVFVKESVFPGIDYPRVPGHEVAGRIDRLGAGVTHWETGARVGVGWHGGHCFHCAPCRAGDFVNCENGVITAISRDGGYAEYMTAEESALARIPDDLTSAAAPPPLCAGVTTFNSLRNSGARAGDLVAIQGVGGLGHLGIQFAARMGFRTVALSRGRDKENLAKSLGAHAYIDTAADSVGEALSAMGGARVILATAPDAESMTPLVDGLGVDGQVIIVGADAAMLAVSPVQLIPGRRSMRGWPSGHAKDSEDALNFSSLSGVRPTIEEFPLERAGEAYERMMANEARFRAVLKIS
ncbi:MAG: alcohol dehydrogenase [Alphaproteobacteria bacterium]|nr:alcohol dehydrogenase [Alphaproteobacteria bacterium]